MTSRHPAFLLAFIVHPELALILLLAGILLIYLEFNRPGAVVFACMGMLSATFGVYSLAQHSVSHASLIVAVAGLIVILLELRFRAHNVLAILGTLILAYALAALMPPPIRIGSVTALAVAVIFSVVTVWLGRIAMQARRNKRVGRVDWKTQNFF